LWLFEHRRLERWNEISQVCRQGCGVGVDLQAQGPSERPFPDGDL